MDAVFRDCVREARAAGKTILLSSHILAEVEALADRVTIIRLGKAVESGTLADLRHLTRTSISVQTARPVTGLDALPGVHDVVTHNTDATFDVDSAHVGAVLTHLTAFDVRALTSTPPTLEELFLRHYGDELAFESSIARTSQR
jgi:ABC-2 type transport system ATP-binding protein